MKTKKIIFENMTTPEQARRIHWRQRHLLLYKYVVYDWEQRVCPCLTQAL